MIRKFSEVLNEEVKKKYPNLTFKNVKDDETVFEISYYGNKFIEFELDYYPQFEESQNIFFSLDENQTKELISFLQETLRNMKAKEFNL